MAIPSRQIGWGTESNLLWQILKQLNKLTSVLFGLKEAATPNYKVYTALISQAGQNDPEVIVLENTIGNLDWGYRSTGSYSVELIDAFTVDKTAFFISGLDGASGNNGGSPLGPGTSLTWASTGRLNLYVMDPSGNLGDDYLFKYPIEIRVYN